jgi:C_GCAxxG_C_C family probable redox protein
MEKYVEMYNAFGKDQPEGKQPLFHMNCAEVLLRAANDKYDLNLPEVSFRMLQGFGAGFYSERTCGAFSGALAALGAMYTEERPSDQSKMTKAAKLLVKEFEAEFGSLNCDDIKKHFRDPATGCNPVKLKAGSVFDRVVSAMESE